MAVEFVQEERVVRAYIINQKDNAELLKARGRAVDELMRCSGELVFEIEVKQENLLLVVAFGEESMLKTWEALVSPVVLNPVNNCRVLSVSDENLKTAVLNLVQRHNGFVLKTKLCNIYTNEYRLLVYFPKEEDMRGFSLTIMKQNL